MKAAISTATCSGRSEFPAEREPRVGPPKEDDGLAVMIAGFRAVETQAVDETELRKPRGGTFDHAAHGITNTIEEQPRDPAARLGWQRTAQLLRRCTFATGAGRIPF
jgi:hypothetical protein